MAMRPVELNAANRRLDRRRSFNFWQLDRDRALERQGVQNQIPRLGGPSGKELLPQAAAGIACECFDPIVDAGDFSGIA